MKYAIAALLLLMAFATYAPAQSTEGSVSAHVWLPGAGDYDLYGTGLGAGYTHRVWPEEGLGYAFHAGLGVLPAGEGDRVSSALNDFQGESYVIPLGVSALYPFGSSGFTLEAGLQFWLTESEITARHPDYAERVEIETGQTLLGLVAVQRDWALSESQTLGFDAGYQFDLVSGDLKAVGIADRDSDLQAFLMRFSWRWFL